MTDLWHFFADGKENSLRDFSPYDNPYSQAPFDPETIEIKNGEEWLRLELKGFRRSFSSTFSCFFLQRLRKKQAQTLLIRYSMNKAFH